MNIYTIIYKYIYIYVCIYIYIYTLFLNIMNYTTSNLIFYYHSDHDIDQAWGPSWPRIKKTRGRRPAPGDPGAMNR